MTLERSEIVQRRNDFLKERAPLIWIALNHHRNHKNERLSFINYLYLKDIYTDTARSITIKKSTQCGITEFMLIREIEAASRGRSILYVLPTLDLKRTFVQERIDKTILYTPFYQALQKGGTDTDNTSIKTFGSGSIILTASNSSSGFTMHAIDDVVIDELDECYQDYLSMTDERQSNSKDPRKLTVGNPTISNFGIDYEFNRSDRKLWHIKCDCGAWIAPDFFSHVVRVEGGGKFKILDPDYDPKSSEDARMICNECGKPLNRFNPGVWVPQETSEISGYHISKLFSTRNRLKDLISRYSEGLKNDSKMARFYNGDLGLSYIAAGSRISFEDLDACVEDYVLQETSSKPCVIGIDVGKTLHVVIAEVNGDKLRIVYADEVRSREDVEDLHKRFHVEAGVIDALPETRLSREICDTLGYFMSYFTSGLKESVNDKDHVYSSGRTESLDNVKEAFLLKTISLPKNLKFSSTLAKNNISAYYNHINNSIRNFNEKKNAYEWSEGNNPDHFLLATAYLLMARKLLISGGKPEIYVF